LYSLRIGFSLPVAKKTRLLNKKLHNLPLQIRTFPGFLRLLVFCIPLPYLASQAGWIVAEMGRQPWIVYGLMRTRDAVSPNVAGSQVMFSLIGFGLLYTLLLIVGLYLMIHHVRKGPDPDTPAPSRMSSTPEPEV